MINREKQDTNKKSHPYDRFVITGMALRCYGKRYFAPVWNIRFCCNICRSIYEAVDPQTAGVFPAFHQLWAGRLSWHAISSRKMARSTRNTRCDLIRNLPIHIVSTFITHKYRFCWGVVVNQIFVSKNAIYRGNVSIWSLRPTL